MIVVNKYLVPNGYKGLTIYPFIILKDEEYRNDIELINHEKIHIKQQLEMLIIPFFLWYFIEFLKHYYRIGDRHRAYMQISFEREAYSNEKNLEYIKTRKMYSSLKYL